MLVPAVLIAIIGTGLLPIASSEALWSILVMLGIFHTAYTSLSNTMVLETDEFGFAYSGTGIGLVYTLMRTGAFVASPLGNSLATISAGMPFVFWTALFVCGAVILMFVKETGWKVKADKKRACVSL